MLQYRLSKEPLAAPLVQLIGSRRQFGDSRLLCSKDSATAAGANGKYPRDDIDLSDYLIQILQGSHCTVVVNSPAVIACIMCIRFRASGVRSTPKDELNLTQV